MKIWGLVKGITTNPPRNEMASITVEVSGGGQSQTITIRAGGGDSLWDALKNQLPVEVEIASGPRPLMSQDTREELRRAVEARG